MSLSITETITCPACGAGRDTAVWTSVNADLNPELKAKLLDGSLLRYRCPDCGETTLLDRELLYHDMTRRVMVQRLTLDATPPDLSSLVGFLTIRPGKAYSLRVVRSIPELVEKVRLLDEGLDDRVVEAYKAMLADRLRQRGLQVDRILYLGPADAEDMARWQVYGTEPREVSTEFRAGYQEMRQALRPAIEAEMRGLRWVEVDESYFHHLMTRTELKV